MQVVEAVIGSVVYLECLDKESRVNISDSDDKGRVDIFDTILAPEAMRYAIL